MYLKSLQQKWDSFGHTDPLWAVLASPQKQGNKWRLEEFLETGQEYVRSLMEYILSLGVDVPRSKALDFGCGVGRLTQALAQYFGEVHGVDISPSMIALARRYNSHGARCQYRVNRSSDLRDFPHDSLDFVCSFITLQHIEPRWSKRYIKEFLRILAPHGVLIFQLPSELSPGIRSRRLKKIRQLVKPIVPMPVLNACHRARHGNQPVLDMFGIPRNSLIRFIEENQAKVIDVVQDGAAGEDWISFRYCVTK